MTKSYLNDILCDVCVPSGFSKLGIDLFIIIIAGVSELVELGKRGCGWSEGGCNGRQIDYSETVRPKL